jgi:DNA polymerase III subunit epsilon
VAKETARPSGEVGQRPLRAPRPHAPSLDELAAHAQFIAGLKDPLWATIH